MSDVSPDYTQYTDLSLYDADPSDLAQAAVNAGQVQFPGWLPEAGNTEVALIGSLAVIASELIYAVNRVVPATVSTLLQLYGITQNAGQAATANLTISFVDTQGYTLPAPATFQLTIPSGTFLFDTTADAVSIPGGAASVTVPAICEVFASAPNGTPIGTVLSQPVQSYNISSVVLASAPTGGSDAETNAQYLNRAAGTLQANNFTLVTAQNFQTAALNDVGDGVFRASVTDLWNPALNSGQGGQAAGYVTIAVLGQGGVYLSSGQKSAIQAKLQANCVAGLSVSVVDPSSYAVPIDVTVWLQPGYTAGQVTENIQATLVAPPADGGMGLTRELWPWSNIFRRNDCITAITRTPGVAYVVSLNAPPADFSIFPVGPLIELGTLAVETQGP